MGNPKVVLPWIESMMDFGLMNIVLDMATYDVLRDDLEFIALATRNTVICALVRKSVEAQIADAKENWIMPESL